MAGHAGLGLSKDQWKWRWQRGWRPNGGGGVLKVPGSTGEPLEVFETERARPEWHFSMIHVTGLKDNLAGWVRSGRNPRRDLKTIPEEKEFLSPSGHVPRIFTDQRPLPMVLPPLDTYLLSTY